MPAFILLVLTDGPTHGGAIHNALLKRLPNYNADTGAIYRTLQEMEQNKEIEFSWDTSASGPARKVYRLTPAGWARLEYWKDDIEERLKYLNLFLESYRKIKSPEP